MPADLRVVEGDIPLRCRCYRQRRQQQAAGWRRSRRRDPPRGGARAAADQAAMAAVLVVRDFVDSNREIFVVIFLLLSGRIRQHLTEGTSN